MPIITVWQWRDLDEHQLAAAIAATAALEYPPDYQSFLFVDGSGGIGVGPDDEPVESQALRWHVMAKWCRLTSRQAMTPEQALAIAPTAVEIIESLQR